MSICNKPGCSNEHILCWDCLAAENERLRAALKPFADFADMVASEHPGWDHDAFTITDGLTMAPFRAARGHHQQSVPEKS